MPARSTGASSRLFARRLVIAALAGLSATLSCNEITNVPPPELKPGSPAIVSVTPDNRLAIVAFTAPTDQGSTPITNYEVSIDGGATWQPRSPVSTASPLFIEGLTNGSSYVVALRAVNSVGQGTPSSAIAVVPRTTPAAPTLETVAAGNTQLTLAFAEPADDGGAIIVNYKVSMDDGATWTVRTPASVSTPWTVSSLANGTTYKLRVRAVNEAGDGAASNMIEGKPVTTPAAPTITAITPGNQQLSVAFTAPNDGGSPITNYEISLDDGATWSTRQPLGVVSPLVVHSLSNGTSYKVRLRALNAIGSGSPSATVSVAPRTVPGAPSITAVTASNAQLTIAFDAPADTGGATVLNYEYSTDGGITWAVRAPSSATAPLTISGLTNGTSYNIVVRAVNAAGAGNGSNAVTGTPITVAGAPSLSSVTPGNTSLLVAFTAPASNGGASITNYEFSTDDGVTWKPRSPAGTASPIAISELTNGTTYAVRLRAVNDAGHGAASNTLSSSPVPDRPAAPSIGTIATGNATLSVAFSPPAVDGGAAITNYEFSEDGGQTWTARTPASVTSPLVLTGLTNGTAYSIVLRAVNSAGAGEPSDPKPGTPFTVPGAPNISSAIPGNASLSVAFTAPLSDGGAVIANYEYSIDGGATWTPRAPASVASPIIISALLSRTTYAVGLRAVNAAGPGASAPPISASTLPDLPTAPVIDSITPGNASLIVAFTRPSSDGGAPVTNYEYSTDGGQSWFARNPANVTSPWIISGLTNGIAYDVKLRASNDAGLGPASTGVSATPFTVPGAPSITSVTPGDQQLSIAFNAPAADGGSSVRSYEYSTDGGATWSAVSPPLPAGPFVIGSLANGTTYSVRLRAVNAAGAGAASPSTSGCPRTVPSAPAIANIDVGPGELSIVFAPGSDGGAPITNYEYSTDGGSNWTLRSPVSTASPLVITGLAYGVPYAVRLRAINEAGVGAAAGGDMVIPPVPPAAPTVVSVTPGDGQLTVSFTAPTFDGGAAITNYEYSFDDGATWTALSPASVATQFSIANLTNGQTYQVRVRAINGIGGGGQPSNAMPGVPSGSATVPPAGTITSATRGDAQVSIAFNMPALDGGSSIINIEYSVDDGATWTARSPAGISSPLIISGLTNGTTYKVRFRAMNGVGGGVPSNAVDVTPATVPGAPAITGITPANMQLSVAFTAPTVTGGAAITNYEYSVDNGATWTVPSPGSVMSPIAITGLVNGMTYQVMLRAVNDVGSGAASPASDATPVSDLPGAPTLDSVTRGNSQLTIAFSAPATDGGASITNYEYSLDGGTTWVPRSPASVQSPFVITSLLNGTAYRVRLRALNAAGPGAASSELPGTPAIFPPSPTLDAVVGSSAQLTVSFTPPSENGGAPLTNYEYSLDNGTTWTARNPATLTSPLVIGGLTNGTTYQVRIRAVNDVGPGVQSDVKDGVPGGPVVVPGAPSITAIASIDRQLLLTIAAPASDGGAPITNYEYSLDDGTTWVARDPASTNADLTLSPLNNGTTYTVRVRAVNSAGPGPASEPVSGIPAGVPSPPTVTSVVRSTGQLTVAFTTPTTDPGAPITNYEYSLDDATTWTPRDPASTTSPIVISGVADFVSYAIRVRAINRIGAGTPSDAVVTDAVVPSGVWSGTLTFQEGGVGSALPSVTVPVEVNFTTLSATAPGFCGIAGTIQVLTGTQAQISWPQCGATMVTYTATPSQITGSGPHIASSDGRTINTTWALSPGGGTGMPTQLAIAAQPTGATTDQSFGASVVVHLRDVGGNLTTSGNQVTATIASGTGALVGTTTVTAVNGVATFANLKISGTGVHTLRFESAGLASATTAVITVASAPGIWLRTNAVSIAAVDAGQVLSVPVVLDLSGAPGENVAALTFRVQFDQGRFELSSLENGTFGSVIVNSAHAATLGQLDVSVFAASGATSSQTLVTVMLRAKAVETPTVSVLSSTVNVAGNQSGAVVAIGSRNLTATIRP